MQLMKTDIHNPARRQGDHRSLLGWWPLITGLAVGAFSIATDDPDSVDGVLLTLLIPTCAYALIALVGTAIMDLGLDRPGRGGPARR